MSHLYSVLRATWLNPVSQYIEHLAHTITLNSLTIKLVCLLIYLLLVIYIALVTCLPWFQQYNFRWIRYHFWLIPLFIKTPNLLQLKLGFADEEITPGLVEVEGGRVNSRRKVGLIHLQLSATDLGSMVTGPSWGPGDRPQEKFCDHALLYFVQRPFFHMVM